MPKTRAQKEEVVRSIVERMDRMKSVVFSRFFGIKISDSDVLRKRCRDEALEHMVVKKTILARALEERKITGVDPRAFEGEVAVTFSYGDEVAAARTVAQFARDHKTVTFLGAIVDGHAVDAAAVSRLAALPSRQELLGHVVGTVQAPISGFVNVLAGNIRGLVTVLSALKDSKS